MGERNGRLLIRSTLLVERLEDAVAQRDVIHSASALSWDGWITFLVTWHLFSGPLILAMLPPGLIESL